MHDSELDALNTCLDAIESLDESAQLRIASYLYARYCIEDCSLATASESTTEGLALDSESLHQHPRFRKANYFDVHQGFPDEPIDTVVLIDD